MAKILAIAENFAFGPISKLVTVVNELKKQGHEVTFIGYGTAYQLGSIQGYDNCYEFDTDSKEFAEWGKSIFKKHDLLISSCDRSSMLLAKQVGLPRIWLDILFWWWDGLPDFVYDADLFIQQNSLNNERNMKKFGHLVKNMFIVGPIIDLTYKDIKQNNTLFISYGGMEAKGWYTIGKESNYPYTITDLIIKKVDISSYDKVIFSGNAAIMEELKNRHPGDKFSFGTLNRPEILRCIGEARDVLIIPGLETPLEAIAYNKSVMYLPPSNSSQYVQLDEFRKIGLADKQNSIHFADYYPYKNLAGKDLRKIMDIFLKELKIYEHDNDALDNTAKRINQFIHSSQKSRNEQIKVEKKFMKSLGDNGLNQSVKIINKFINTLPRE